MYVIHVKQIDSEEPHYYNNLSNFIAYPATFEALPLI